MNCITHAKIEARPISVAERLDVLPRHFGRHMMSVEHVIYTFLRKMATTYTGGYWEYYELSNGGFYMAPKDAASYALSIDSNGFEGSMGADAAGITACLFAYSHLSFRFEDERISEAFHRLREFALDHAEASVIFAAID